MRFVVMSQEKTSVCQKYLQTLTIVCGVASLTGCIPATYVTVPAIRGRVVDSEARPVAGAEVQVTRSGRAELIGSMTTDADGSFHRREEGRFFLYLVPADNFLSRYDVQARTGSRVSPTTQVSSGVRYFFVFGPPSSGIDVGDLRLR